MRARDLRKLDTFYMQYGYCTHRFIVVAVNDKGVHATLGNCLKSSCVFFSFEELDNHASFMLARPYSKLRWFLKM